MKYISDVSKDHQTRKDMKKIREIFSGFERKDSGLGHLIGLDRKKAQLAYETLFDEWNIDLTSE